MGDTAQLKITPRLCKPTLQNQQTLSQTVHRVGDKEEKQLKHENLFSILEIGPSSKRLSSCKRKVMFSKKREKERLVATSTIQKWCGSCFPKQLLDSVSMCYMHHPWHHLISYPLSI